MKVYFKLILVFILFEVVSYKLFGKFFYQIAEKYEYMDWVYYFYFPSKNGIFFFYLYFIFTSSAFFTLLIWYKIYKNNPVKSNNGRE